MTGNNPPPPPVSIRDRLRSFTPFRRKSQPDKLHPAPVPPEKRVVYAVGDIHGRYDLLIELEDRISRDLAERGSPPSLLVFLGDYVDRGPESREVLTHLAAGASPCDQHVFLRGNHEQVMIDLLGSADMLDAWAKFGGIETLVSYGLRPRLPLSPEGREHLRRELLRVLPPSHKSFLIATRYSHETDDFFFAHAGVNPAFDLERTDAQQWGGGIGRLFVDGRPAGEGRLPRVGVPSPIDTFDIGADRGSPVSTRYAAPARFQGVVEEVRIALQ